MILAEKFHTLARVMDQLNVGKKVNPKEVVLVNAAEEIVLYSANPDIKISRDQMLTLPSTSTGTSMARNLLKVFFDEKDLGKINRKNLESQHPRILESIYGNLKNLHPLTYKSIANFFFSMWWLIIL